MICSRTSQRTAFTLIEMLVAIVAMSFVAAAACVLLAAFTRSSEGINDSVQQQRTLARLGEQFRHDVRAAAQVQTQPTLKFTTSATTSIEYRRTDEGLERVVADVSGKPTHRELYRLPKLVDCAWHTSDKKPAQVTLRLSESAEPALAAGHLLVTFTAVLHSDQRFAPAKAE